MVTKRLTGLSPRAFISLEILRGGRAGGRGQSPLRPFGHALRAALLTFP